MTRSVRMLRSAGRNYADIEDQVFSMVEALLPEPDPSADSESLNVVSTLGTPGDVLLSHSMRDRNYFGRDGRVKPELEAFECIVVPGEWLRERILRNNPEIAARPHSVLAAGHPRVDALRRMKTLRAARKGDERIRILWAPAYRVSEQSGDIPSISSNPSFLSWIDRLDPWCEVVIWPHPKDRKITEDGTRDLHALTSELVDCDVVVTDSSSVMFDAWSIDRPVIFPRWLTGDAVSRRFPGSAEDHVYSNRIGYHADSIEELLQIVQDGPLIGQDVKEFMGAYVANYQRADSSSKIAEVLRRLADPHEQERYEIRQQLLTRLVISASELTPLVSRGQSRRASTALLQDLLFASDYNTFSNTIVSLRRTRTGGELIAEVDVLEVDAALVQGDLAGADRLIERLQPEVRGYFLALRSVLNGDPEGALIHLDAYLSGSPQGFAPVRLLVDVLAAVGEHDRAWTVLRALGRGYRAPETLTLMAAYVTNSMELRFLEETAGKVAASHTADRALIALPLIDGADRVLGGDSVVERARELMLSVVRERPATPILAGWPEEGVPRITLPIERIPAITPEGMRRLRGAALTDISSRIEHADLPLVSSEPWRSPRGAGGASVEEAEIAIEFRVSSDEQDALDVTSYGATLGLMPRSGYQSAQRARFLHASGIPVDIIATASGTEMSGIGTTEPPGEGRSVAEARGETLRLMRTLLSARAYGDERRAMAAARQLKLLGEPEAEITLAGMADNHLRSDLADLMMDARFILHIGDGVDAEFHLKLWLEYVQTVDPAAIIAIRSRPLFDRLSKTYPELNAVYVRSGIEAEWLVSSCPQLVGVLYVSNTGNAVHFLRFNHLRHVFLGHGDSEKAASCHKFFRAYDEVWTAGRAHIDRFRNSGMAHDSIRFRVVGRPTLRGLLGSESAVGRDAFLYLPTWEGFQVEQEYTSLQMAGTFIPQVAGLTGLRALVKVHPWAGKRMPALNQVERELQTLTPAAGATIEVIERALPAADFMDDAAFLISDISSVVSDYLPTGRPIFLYVPAGSDIRTSTSNLQMDSYCYVFSDSDELAKLVRRVIVDGDDWLQDVRQAARTYFVDPRQTLDGAFEFALRDVVESQVGPGRGWSTNQLTSSATSFRDQPFVIGHRGMKGEIVENSLSGFRAAAALTGLDGVELDVHLSADGNLVVLHDPILDRTTDGSGPVAARTLTELRRVRLRDLIKGSGYLEEGIPTLQEVLDVLAPSDLEIHIELKTDSLGSPYAGLEQRVLDTIRSSGLADRCVLTSFAPTILRELRNMDASIALLGSVNPRSVEMLGGIEKCLSEFGSIPGCALAIEHRLMESLTEIRPGLVDARRVGVWVVNSPDQIRTAVDLGVRQITTDLPREAIELANRRV